MRLPSMRALAGTIMTVSIGLTGCSIFPYSENFGCENMNQYGRCIDVKDAYEMAVTGEVKGQPISKKEHAPPPNEGENQGVGTVERINHQERYQAERYRKLSALVEAPKAPMVKQPEVVRTLVLNYSDRTRSGAPLYGHRYIHFFGSDPEWVMGPTMKTSTEQLMKDIVE